MIVEKADHNFSAYVPDLLGCVTTGGTLIEIEQNIKEAIAGHLQVMREYGDSMPESSQIYELNSPTSIILQVNVPC